MENRLNRHRHVNGSTIIKICWLLFFVLLVTGCGKEEDVAPPEQKSTKGLRITAIKVKPQNLPVKLEAVGTVESKTAPFIAAEEPGRVVKVLVDIGDVVHVGQVLAEIDRRPLELQRDAAKAETGNVSALITNQELVTKRYRRLSKKKLLSQTLLDEAEAQLAALKEQLTAARARLAIVDDQLAKTRIASPITGIVDQRLVSVGDYVKKGNPLFRVANTESLQIILPFPEPVANQLKRGLKVEIITAINSELIIEETLSELRPMIEGSNKSITAIVELHDPTLTKPGASVLGKVIIGIRENALLVPEQSVVRRPAGEVVYVINGTNVQGTIVQQRVVHTGLRYEGRIEIIEGLTVGEIIAVDGAGFLTDNAPVTVQGNR